MAKNQNYPLKISLLSHFHLSSREKSLFRPKIKIINHPKYGIFHFSQNVTFAGTQPVKSPDNSPKHLCARDKTSPPRQNTVKERINVIYRREERLKRPAVSSTRATRNNPDWIYTLLPPSRQRNWETRRGTRSRQTEKPDAIKFPEGGEPPPPLV